MPGGCPQGGHLCSQEVVLQGAELGAQEGAVLPLDITQHLPYAAAQLGSPALHMPARRQDRCILSRHRPGSEPSSNMQANTSTLLSGIARTAVASLH